MTMSWWRKECDWTIPVQKWEPKKSRTCKTHPVMPCSCGHGRGQAVPFRVCNRRWLLICSLVAYIDANTKGSAQCVLLTCRFEQLEQSVGLVAQEIGTGKDILSPVSSKEENAIIQPTENWNHTQVQGWDRRITVQRMKRRGLWSTVSNTEHKCLDCISDMHIMLSILVIFHTRGSEKGGL